MDRGLIREKIDIKILILFILRRLPEPVGAGTIWGVARIDEGFSYFEFMECLDELVDTGHVTRDREAYAITEKGVQNGGAVESGIPYSVRAGAERELVLLARDMRRNAMILCSSERTDDGAFRVALSLSDGLGEIISLRLLVPDEERANKAERSFRGNAEQIYTAIAEMLMADS